MLSGFVISICVLYLIGTVLHSFGFILLFRIVRRGSSPYNLGQRLFLLHLILVEICACVLFFTTQILFEWKIGLNIARFLYISLRTSGYVNYIGSMLLLTIDRVLLVRLNLRYPLFMSMKKILLSTSGIFLLGGIYFAVIISSPSGISNIYLFHAVTSLTFLVFVFLAYLWIHQISNNIK